MNKVVTHGQFKREFETWAYCGQAKGGQGTGHKQEPNNQNKLILTPVVIIAWFLWAKMTKG